MSPSLREMADAYILTAVLAYSAAYTTYFSVCLTFSVLGAVVLLINSHYLHAPIHIPSTLLAFVVLFLPLYNARAILMFNSLATTIAQTPYFIVELVLFFLLFGWFFHLAIFRPLANARNSRRAVTPILLQPVQPTTRVLQPTTELEKSEQPGQSEQSVQAEQSGQIGQAERAKLTEQVGQAELTEQPGRLEGQPTASTEPQAAQAAAVEEPLPRSLTAAQARATAMATLQPRASASATAAHMALQPTPAARQAETRMGNAGGGSRRRRAPTQSQLLAVKIMAQKEEEERRRREAVEKKQRELQERSEALRMEREEREVRRSELQGGVREAARGVREAKERLAAATARADEGRMGRRRAADQLALAESEENERVLDEACKEAARLETAEQAALNEVNAAQARLVESQDRLNLFDRRRE